MQQGRRWFLAAPLALATIAFGQPDAACPAFPSDDLAHGGDTFTVGGWTLVAGRWLATCAQGSVLWVTCADEGDALTIRLSFPALDAPSYAVSFTDAVTAVLTTGPLVSADGGITLDDVDADRVIPMLSSSAVLRVTVTPDGGAEAARDVVFPTAGFEEALPWLGCGAADTCPVRSCGR